MSIEIYKRDICLGMERLKTTELFQILQDVATEHCNEIGYGGDVIGPKGLIWVIARYRLEVKRWPDAGECIHVVTWPGKTRHMLFPRHYIIEDAAGNTILEASAIWTLMDQNERKMVRPGPYGVELDGIVTGREVSLPSAPKKLPIIATESFIVPERFLDVNRHMNNIKYYELAENCFGETINGLHLKAASTEYASEALLGDEVKLSWGREGNSFYITGENHRTVFKMNLEYA